MILRPQDQATTLTLKSFTLKELSKGRLFMRTKTLTDVEMREKWHISKVAIYSHDFVTGCSETLIELDRKFNRESELTVDYDAYSK